MLKIVTFKEYDPTKQRLPISAVRIKAGELVDIYTSTGEAVHLILALTQGQTLPTDNYVAQHDCEPKEPITVLFTQHKLFDSLWVFDND